MRIPLFTGFRDTYRVRQAEAQAAQAEAARDNLYQQTELDVWQSYYDLQTAGVDRRRRSWTSAGRSPRFTRSTTNQDPEVTLHDKAGARICNH